MIFYHVDVFSSKILSGNGLTVIFHEEDNGHAVYAGNCTGIQAI